MMKRKLAPSSWILVADSQKALFLENVGDEVYPIFDVVRKKEQDNPPARDHAASRPGRFNDGPSVHRSAVQDTDWHELEKERFADDLAEILYRLAHKHRFEQIVLVAAPTVLGRLRKSLHHEVGEKVIGEIAKDLTNHPIEEIEKIVVKDFTHVP